MFLVMNGTKDTKSKFASFGFAGKKHSKESNAKSSISIKQLYEEGNTRMGQTPHKTKEAKHRARLSSQMRHRYGITIEDYERMYLKQGAVCAICNLSCSKLVIDHDHVTLKVRGLLCHKCNFTLGAMNDSVANLKNAIKYLLKNNNK